MSDSFVISRRTFLAAAGSLAAAGALSAGARASETPRDILWEDLIPNADERLQATMNRLGVVQHGGVPAQTSDDYGKDLVKELIGQNIRIAGYIIPLDYDGVGVKELILVPYVGACIHVPPPPPNQLILVRTEQPYDPREMFEPVYVAGTLGILNETNDLAEVGYSLQADSIEPYQ
ncbi:DUF3299 domain-containing protein [Nisaea sediminum]|uniref:DUF3299 domain-containing protein n=1 Tax=Nisaea sediminum TaxID=2775867 RepID=UPI001869606A|nr:DUF3299 domain-containing protein [Nisaea sediminum]